MRCSLIVFSLLFSLNLFGVEFRSFDDYKNNNALLESDVERLESMKREKHDQLNDQIFIDTIYQYRLLLKNYESINNRLNLQSFVSDANENGWKITASKALDLVAVCEGSTGNIEQCIQELNKLKVFVEDSNLALANKESINGFIDNYITESKHLSVFDDEFISSFNQNSSLINQQLKTNEPISKMTVRITPVKKTPVIESVKRNYFWQYIIFSSVLFCLLGFVFIYKKSKMSKALKCFYRNVFQVANKNKIKIRLFGQLDSSGLALVGNIEKAYLETIPFLNTFASEARVKFKTSDYDVKVETEFLCNLSLISFMEKEALVLKEKLENLQREVSECGGEFIYCNQFNLKGEVAKTSYIISLPKKS